MMRNTFAIILALTLAVFMANAKQKSDNMGTQDNERFVSDGSMHESDSGSFINSDSQSSAKTKTKFLKKPIFSKNTRKTREATVINSKLEAESESASNRDSPLRRRRSAEDNEDIEPITTTPLPFENNFTSYYATTDSSTDIVQNSTDESTDSSQLVTENPEFLQDDTDTDPVNNIGDSTHSDQTISTNYTTTPTTSLSDDEKQNSPPELNENSTLVDNVQNNMTTIVYSEQTPLDDQTVTLVSSPSDDNGNTQLQASNSPSELDESTPIADEKSNASTIKSSEKTNNEHLTPSSSPLNNIQEQYITSPSELDEDNDMKATTLINDLDLVDVSTDNHSTDDSPTITMAGNTKTDETTNINEDNSLDTDVTEHTENDGVTNVDNGISDADDDITDLDSGIPDIDDEVVNVDSGITNADDEVTDDALEETTNSSIDILTTVETESSESTIASSISTTRPDKKYNFIVYDESNVPCTLASMSITLRIHYETKDKKMHTKAIPVPPEASVSGNCGAKESRMTLSWTVEGSHTNRKSSITFTIVKDDACFYVSNVQVSVITNNENFPNVADEELQGNSTIDLRLFSASVNNGVHVCRPMTEVPCGEIVVLIKDVSLIAYNGSENVSNREEERCFAPKSISVAAIVGGIVGLTITIGIVASYAWYRKRTSTFRSELP